MFLQSEYESRLHEIDMLVDEIDIALRSLKTWMKPERVTRYILQSTDSAYTIREPLGVVLVIGAW